MKFYGASTGETGQYGVGDIVEGTSYTLTSDGNLEIDGEPVFQVFTIADNKLEHIQY
jgi:hypothetical protein